MLEVSSNLSAVSSTHTATGLSSSSDDITMARDFFVGLTAESVLDPIDYHSEGLAIFLCTSSCIHAQLETRTLAGWICERCCLQRASRLEPSCDD